jgi:hypothetical protein
MTIERLLALSLPYLRRVVLPPIHPSRGLRSDGEGPGIRGSDVVDMDAGTPNIRWADSSGDPPPGHHATAFNHFCPAAGQSPRRASACSSQGEKLVKDSPGRDPHVAHGMESFPTL